MINLKGNYNSAVVFTNNLEKNAKLQIENLLNQKFIKDSKIRIMPDVHAGIGCTIGTTMTITNKIVPNLVGVDIGCGVETVKIKNSRLELEKLDKIIHEHIPSGFEIRKSPHQYFSNINLEDLKSFKHINYNRAKLSLGTLGGGNHFIELSKDEDNNTYLIVHSGSRNLGKQVADYYQKLAYENMVKNSVDLNVIIDELKKSGQEKKINKEIKKFKSTIDKNLAYLEGDLFHDYLHDMKIVQKYAEINRHAIVNEIIKKMKLKVIENFTTIHNYIDIDSMILRKGAISAKEGEKLLIPINMRDGSLICTGKGNEDWNFSAPHGAGRLLSRKNAKESFTLHEFKNSMKGIYSSTVGKGTLDEAPFAYKPKEEIIENIKDTVNIISTLKPIYNFKAKE